MRNLLAPLALVAILPTSALAESTIRAEHEPASRAHQLDVVLTTLLGRYPGFLPGVIYGFPVAPQGFISTLNEAFYIEAGIILGVFFDPSFFWMAPVVGPRWSFYLTEQWAVFGALRLGWGFEFDDRLDHNFFYADVTVGAHWHFSELFALRLETGGGNFGWHGIVGLSIQLGI
jgi:hypothetical protein